VRQDLSAIQEVEQHYHIPVISVACLDDVVTYLQELPQYRDALTAMRDYRRRYGVAEPASI
jgi:orotate phosphoribosyltransferase